MSKFSRSLVTRPLPAVPPNTTIEFNKAGGTAFPTDPLSALYRQVATSLWSGDGYYERQDEWFARFQANVTTALETDVSFPFRLAAYARDKRGLALRTSPLSLYVEAAESPLAKGSKLIRQYAPRVLLRADEPAEALAYHFKYHNQGVIPHGLLRGIADTLPSFDEYALSKYKNTGGVSLRDVFRLARPRPADDAQRELWNRVVTDTLAVPYTWETELSKGTDKRATWNDLLASGKLGLFALVRNIRNILEAGADIEVALSQITSDRIVGSGILPFQWYKAYKAVSEKYGHTIAAPLIEALELSLNNIRLPGVTLVVCDNSSSMSMTTRTRGMTNAEIGNLMGAMALRVCEPGSEAGTFGEDFAIADTQPQRHIIDNYNTITACGQTTGHSTNAWKIFQALTYHRIYVDRVIIFSDMQCYDNDARQSFVSRSFMSHSLSSEIRSYMQAVNPNIQIYSVDLDNYDNTVQYEPDQPVVQLAGWSDSIFQYIAALESGQNVLAELLKGY